MKHLKLFEGFENVWQNSLVKAIDTYRYILEDEGCIVRKWFDNVKSIFKDKLNTKNYINLQIYKNEVLQIKDIEKWGAARYFDVKTKTLYQPWGTNLLAKEFKKPTFNKNSLVFWVGSVWNDKNNQGNINEINELRTVLNAYKLKFINIRFIPDWLNILLIRNSRIAPAISGKSQVEMDYPPCRLFKNISYGQLGISNVSKSKEILGDNSVKGNSIEELIENALSLSKEEYISKIKAQQEIVKKYTYKESLENIIRALNIK